MDAAAALELCRQNGIDPAHVIEQLDRDIARENLIEFSKRLYPGFKAPKHIRYLADLLEKAERGEIKRLAISIGPGHGKSTLLQCFIAWFLGRAPRRRVLAISATENLAKRNSRMTQDLVTSVDWPFETKLRGESVLEWSTTEGGDVRAIGRTGNVTGFRAELILVDDLQSDAGSKETQESDEEWFRSVLSTRIEPDGIVVLIQTRWTDGDIIGRLMKGDSADQWHVVNIPAIATSDDDILGRKEGEALWPEKWPVHKLMLTKAEIGSAFDAQFQGDPVSGDGKIFEASWFENRYDHLPECRRKLNTEDRPGPLIRIQSIDCAAKTGIRNDRTAIVTLATDLNNIYVEHVWVDRVAFTELKRKVSELYEAFSPRVVVVEEASNGYALLDDLKESTRIPLDTFKPGSDKKEARAESVTGWFQTGRIKFPRYAPWMSDLLAEFTRFPHGRHDDIVDATVSGIIQMQIQINRVLGDARHVKQVQSLQGWMVR